MSETVSRGYKWRTVRTEVINRDGSKCVACGLTRTAHKERYGRDIEVHHKTPAHIFTDEEGAYEKFAHHKENLVTLCWGCHQRAETNGTLHGVGIMPTETTRRRYLTAKPRELSDTEFIDELLDAYETIQSGDNRIVQPVFDATVEVDAGALADRIAEQMANKYVGIDEAQLASKIAFDVEKRLRGH